MFITILILTILLSLQVFLYSSLPAFYYVFFCKLQAPTKKVNFSIDIKFNTII
jgi:hypothetical protein